MHYFPLFTLWFFLMGCTPATQPERTPPSASTAGGSSRAIEPRGTPTSENLFSEAEKKRAEAEATRLPALREKPRKEAVLRFLKTEAADWMKRRRQACEVADKAYSRLQETGAEPSWLVAAARRRGDLWSSFAEEFLALPVPEEFEQDPPQRAAYREAMEEAMEPNLVRARQSYEKCRELATGSKIEGEHATRCAQWLQAHPAATPR